MTLDELNQIDARINFVVDRMVDGPAGPLPQYRAVASFGDGGTLSIVTKEDAPCGGHAAGVRFDVGFIIGEELAEIVWYEAGELPKLMDALKIDHTGHGWVQEANAAEKREAKLSQGTIFGYTVEDPDAPGQPT